MRAESVGERTEMSMSHALRTMAYGLILFLCAACLGPKGESVSDKRAYAETMRSETLGRLYRERPEAKERMTKMVGHAVFSSINTNLLLLSTASGYGVAVGGGGRTYMKMYQVGVGPGLGIKDYRIVFMFRSQKVFDTFVESGWEFGGQADAAARSTGKGGAVGGQASIESDIVIYTLTEAGVALQATVAGTKYWKDDDLN
jgi:lipid-binding SYLF domain-containing protein